MNLLSVGFTSIVTLDIFPETTGASKSSSSSSLVSYSNTIALFYFKPPYLYCAYTAWTCFIKNNFLSLKISIRSVSFGFGSNFLNYKKARACLNLHRSIYRFNRRLTILGLIKSIFLNISLCTFYLLSFNSIAYDSISLFHTPIKYSNRKPK